MALTHYYGAAPRCYVSERAEDILDRGQFPEGQWRNLMWEAFGLFVPAESLPTRDEARDPFYVYRDGNTNEILWGVQTWEQRITFRSGSFLFLHWRPESPDQPPGLRPSPTGSWPTSTLLKAAERLLWVIYDKTHHGGNVPLDDDSWQHQLWVSKVLPLRRRRPPVAWEAIADQLGVSRTTLYTWRDRWG